MVKKLSYLLMVVTFLPSFTADVTENVKSEAKASVTRKFDKPLLYMDTVFSNSLGVGTLMPRSSRAPSFYTTTVFYPGIKTRPFWDNRTVSFYSEIAFDISWLDGESKDIKAKTDVSFYDLKFRASMNNVLPKNSLGLSLKPGVKVEFPTSKSSKDNNLSAAFGANLTLLWAKKGFFAFYKPTVTGYVYSNPYKSSECQPEELLAPLSTTGQAAEMTVDRPLSNGSCLRDGRQTLVVLKNGLFGGYGFGNHGFTLGFRSYHNFLREAQSFNADKENKVNIHILGIIEYAYSIQTKVPIGVAVGLSTYQPFRHKNGGLNFPFFDFREPSSNNSSIYFDFSVSI